MIHSIIWGKHSGFEESTSLFTFAYWRSLLVRAEGCMVACSITEAICVTRELGNAARSLGV
jgi:hypothetical protein